MMTVTRTAWALVLVGVAASGCKGGGGGHGEHGKTVEVDGGVHAGHGDGGAAMAVAALPMGHAEVTITSERQQLIGLKLAQAERAPVVGLVRASATVQADETREAHVHSKLMGWVKKLYVNAVGQKVRRGDPLYTIYSQDLYAAVQDYLRARSLGNAQLASAARERLALWDVPEDQIRLIEMEGAQRTLTIRAPISGTVIEKGITAGHYLEPGAMLYRIADLSTVWVLASIYEFEVGRIDQHGLAQVLVQGETAPRAAKVDYVYPTVDPGTRTVKVRIVLPNRDGALRPGSFASVELPTLAGEVVSVPDEAVVDTGLRQLVYVALGDGRFRPVEIRVGRRGDGRAEILEGLAAGTTVVVSALFLLDSESRLRGSAGPAGHGGH